MNLIDEYHRAFPGVRLTIFQQEMIEGQVDDERAWRKALEFWAGNGYRPQSIFKIVDYYKGIVNGTNMSFQDKTKIASQVGKWDGEESSTPEFCKVCGKDVCLTWHGAEI